MAVTMQTGGYGEDEEPVLSVTYEGAVLATRERNWYDDSDFYAVVWDGEQVATVEYATTRFPTYNNHARVDATDEVKAAARDWYERWALNALKEWALDTASRPTVGRVVRWEDNYRPRRGAATCLTGETFTVLRIDTFKTGYSEWTRVTRALLRDEEGHQAWTNVEHLRVDDPWDALPSISELRVKATRMADDIAKRGAWHTAFAVGFSGVVA